MDPGPDLVRAADDGRQGCSEVRGGAPAPPSFPAATKAAEGLSVLATRFRPEATHAAAVYPRAW